MIPDQWYAVLEPKEIKERIPLPITRMGEKLVFWRDSKGVLTCMKDFCAHRGAALSPGKIIGDRIQCPFHGFEYDQAGRCQCIPANGRNAKVPNVFQVVTYPVVEAHGFVWLWWGDKRDNYPPLPFFNDIDESFSYGKFHDYWQVHYSRAIENQLDVFHLPFVHATTIGRGKRYISDGPLAILENENMEIWVYSRVEDGSLALRPDDLPEPKRPPQLIFKFPNIWMNRISDDMRIVVAFVPIDDGNCIIYLHQYQRMIKIPLIGSLFNWISILGSKVILKQDKRVVLTQRPIKTDIKMNEKLIVQDRPIILYRSQRKSMIEKYSLDRG